MKGHKAKCSKCIINTVLSTLLDTLVLRFHGGYLGAQQYHIVSFRESTDLKTKQKNVQVSYVQEDVRVFFNRSQDIDFLQSCMTEEEIKKGFISGDSERTAREQC